ncbi:4'-phosphopantetheinyl transferase family protein [Desulfobacca acetoxidans]|uniref:4'-phosphopantetheinyl transferase n=1 Tax=Desulfobacca acetoxidans (strain ATCC 700848 / DSM 11109 / ASRB2) TaxID=880072 RepID=F2NDK5_DESAR|nr:4'-phosphopantetheinyl transferase superfamily protein [Desulfobacca acetoxidans]AEB10281.1 4'-phosphopantetheinyl transferase [Desulfobacca acetoxidans DSM 11109]
MTFSHLQPISTFGKGRVSDSEVHVWTVSLGDWPDSEIFSLKDILNTEELSRAAHYHFEPDRRRFMKRRILLKKLLSFYLNLTPQLIRFRYGLCGKPYLGNDAGSGSWQFSSSHSQGTAVYAISRQRSLGVDLEMLHTIPEIDALLNRWFPPQGAMSLQKLSNIQKHLAFYRMWTREEAYLKAIGAGLGSLGSRPAFRFRPLEPAQPEVSGKPSQSGNWSLQFLTPVPDSIAALAVEGGNYRLRCFQWKPEVDIPSDSSC